MENYCDNPILREQSEIGIVRNQSTISITNHHHHALPQQLQMQLQQQQQHQQQQQQQLQRHQTQVHASQSHQTLAMLPIRDDPSSAFTGLINALLGGRMAGNRTHEVIVHSPAPTLNGRNSLAKAASMSELVIVKSF